jgi:hypothetical protein
MSGRAKYNVGPILVRSRNPIDELLRRGMMEGHHLDSGKRIMTIRNCVFGRMSGRTYNGLRGRGLRHGCSVLHTVTYRLIKSIGPARTVTPSWHLIEIVRFCQPDIDGAYFSDEDYRAIYPFSPNCQNAFGVLDQALPDARGRDRQSTQQRRECGVESRQQT